MIYAKHSEHPWLTKSLPANFSSLTGISTIIEFSNPNSISYHVSVVYYCVFSETFKYDIRKIVGSPSRAYIERSFYLNWLRMIQQMLSLMILMQAKMLLLSMHGKMLYT